MPDYVSVPGKGWVDKEVYDAEQALKVKQRAEEFKKVQAAVKLREELKVKNKIKSKTNSKSKKTEK